jgi:hypothetical protein
MSAMYGVKYVSTIVQVVPEFPCVNVTFADGTQHPVRPWTGVRPFPSRRGSPQPCRVGQP